MLDPAYETYTPRLTMLFQSAADLKSGVCLRCIMCTTSANIRIIDSCCCVKSSLSSETFQTLAWSTGLYCPTPVLPPVRARRGHHCEPTVLNVRVPGFGTGSAFSTDHETFANLSQNERHGFSAHDCIHERRDAGRMYCFVVPCSNSVMAARNKFTVCLCR